MSFFVQPPFQAVSPTAHDPGIPLSFGERRVGLWKSEPTALAAGIGRTADNVARPEASAVGSQEMTFSLIQRRAFLQATPSERWRQSA